MAETTTRTKRKAGHEPANESDYPKRGRQSHPPNSIATTSAIERPHGKEDRGRINRVSQQKPQITQPPFDRLDVFVFGSNSNAELELDKTELSTARKRPFLNKELSANTVGVVQVAVGAQHCAALTHDNTILTRDVNDEAALGRDTSWDGDLVDVGDESSSDSGDSEAGAELNPKEATPNHGIKDGAMSHSSPMFTPDEEDIDPKRTSRGRLLGFG